MIIGIDCRAIAEPAGIGEYVRQTVKHLIKNNSHDQLVLFFADAAIAENYRQTNVRIKILPLARYKKFLPFIYPHWLVPLFLRREKLDICWFPANIIPLGYRGQAAVTIHDLAVYKFPELFPGQLVNLDRRWLVPSSLKRAAKIIAVSQSTKNDIRELFKISDAKITVVPEGGDFDFVEDKKYLPDRLAGQKYFLFIGTIEPRKNLLTLVKAYKNFVQFGGEEILVLAGKSGWKNSSVFEAIAAANSQWKQERIIYLGFIDNNQKAALYRSATALVLPSLYEGFGLPAAEALQFNLPLILSRTSALPEIGGEAAWYFAPNDVNGLTTALKETSVNQSLRQELSAKARLRASRFTWGACAQGVLEALMSAR